MHFTVALFSTFLLAPLVLAAPSGLGARVTRRRESQQSRRGASDVQYTNSWAGALWNEANGTFTNATVTGTFTVPTPSGPIGASAAVWVGFDGYTCTSATLQTGVSLTVESPLPTYSGWCISDSADPCEFSNPIDIFPLDVIKLTVVALSANAGTVTIENLTNGQTMSKTLNLSTPLCGQNVEWIVEDYTLNNNLVPFANFSAITFTNAQAVAAGTKTYYPSGATILDIKQNNQILTNVTTDGASVTIQYV